MWGCTLARAREVYTKVVYSAIAYGASAYHTPVDPKRQALRGIAKLLTIIQSSCLRVIAGVYRATPICSLETETWVPLLDLYLNKRVAKFEIRLGPDESRGPPQRSMQEGRNDYNKPVGTDERQAHRHRPQPAGNLDTENRQSRTRKWLSAGIAEEALECNWRVRW